MLNGKRFLVMSFVALIFAAFVSIASTAADVPVLGDYPSIDEMYEEIDTLAAKSDGMVTTGVYGTSVEGRPLMAFRLARRDGKERPEALLAANIHGNEYIANRVAMGVAHRLIDGDGKDEWITSLLDKIDFWFLPCVNPDGYAKTMEMRGAEPWWVQRKNAHGVDLNRNFPLPGKRWIGLHWAGSPDPEHKNYRGPEPYSEPETRAVGEFVKDRRFFVAMDYHSWGGLLIPPKCPDHKCVAMYKKICKAYNSKQKYEKYTRRQFRLLDTYTGEMEDMLLYEHGVIGICIEMGMTKYNKPEYEKTENMFWLFNPVDWRKWVENDRDASLAAIEKAYELTGGEPLPPERRGKK